MNLRKFVVEFGMGIDQHGQDPTNAARKAVKDAVSRSCLAGLVEIAKLEAEELMVVDVLVACPHAHEVDREQVLRALPFGEKRIEIIEGGLVARSIFQPELGDASDEAYVANAAVTVSVDMDRVLQAWQKEL